MHQLKSLLEKHWPACELFLIAGPTLIGWLIGIWRYQPGEPKFLLAFQAFLAFAAYMSLLTFNHFIAFLNPFSYANIVLYADSVFCLAYLSFSFYQYFKARVEQIEIFVITRQAWQKLNI